MSTSIKKRIISSLYSELENKYSSTKYTNGILRTIYVIARALTTSPATPFNLNWESKLDKSICFVFFKNEFNAALKNKRITGIDEIIEIDSNRLRFLTNEIGWATISRELFIFLKISIEIKGWRIFSKLARPAIGWLLYIYFKNKFNKNAFLRIVSLNLTHPSSLGISWAAYTTQTKLDYCEHAATTLLMLSNPELYRNYYVSHNHTKAMLVSSGLKEENIFLLHESEIIYRWPPSHKTGSIGFCINNLDSLASIDAVTKSLQFFDCAVVCRVHDADRRFLFLEELAIKNQFKIESAKSSSIETFLSKIDLLIAGNSNVIGDALIAEKPVIYFWAGDNEIYDYYGFARFYNIKTANDGNSLNRLLNETDFRALK